MNIRTKKKINSDQISNFVNDYMAILDAVANMQTRQRTVQREDETPINFGEDKSPISQYGGDALRLKAKFKPLEAELDAERTYIPCVDVRAVLPFNQNDFKVSDFEQGYQNFEQGVGQALTSEEAKTERVKAAQTFISSPGRKTFDEIRTNLVTLHSHTSFSYEFNAKNLYHLVTEIAKQTENNGCQGAQAANLTAKAAIKRHKKIGKMEGSYNGKLSIDTAANLIYLQKL